MLYGIAVKFKKLLMGSTSLVLLILLTTSTAACAQGAPAPTPLTGELHTYGATQSGAPLRGVLYKPGGAGPFPVLVYAHGSAPGYLNNEAFEAIAPAFTRQGWAFFAPYRRGQGLSAGAGPFIRDQIATARRSGGAVAAQAELARTLAAEHMEDQAQALSWVARQPFADTRRIAVMGNSFGGIIALLSAARFDLCGAINAAGGAESWREAPALQKVMAEAAAGARAPVLFIQAENDFDLTPSRILHERMTSRGKPAEIRIYPPFGESPAAGHSFPYKAVSTWAADAHSFLARACASAPPAEEGGHG